MISVKLPFDVGFVAPAQDNSFWFITKYGLELHNINSKGEHKHLMDSPQKMYISFVFKNPRFFVPVGVRDKKSEVLISTFDTQLFDAKLEGLEDASDYAAGDELWPEKSPDEDHEDDPEWAIAFTMNEDNSWHYDSSAVIRSACSWPLLAWKRNLKICDQCIDPFSATAPPGVTNAISKSKGIVFCNLSTDRSIMTPEPEKADQICLSIRENVVLVVSGREMFIYENPFFCS